MFRAQTVSAVAALALLAALPVPTFAQAADADGVIATVKYACDDGKTIDATYYADKVDLVLSDGRTLTVPQAMSASGARYANADETFVFWNKGDGAFITEGGDPNATPTFDNCLDVTKKT